MKIYGCFLVCLVMILSVNGKSLQVWPSNANQTKAWKTCGGASWEKTDNGYVLSVNNQVQGAGIMNAFPLNLNAYAGYGLILTGEIKAENVSRPQIGWLGIKFMLPYQYGGMTTWLSATDGMHGTFDWKSFSLKLTILPGLDRAEIALGLQDSTGTVRFRNLKAELVAPNQVFPMPYTLPENFRCEYSEDLLKRPPMRGAMVNDPRYLQVSDLAALAGWNANLIRWQFNASNAGNLQQYEAQINASVEKLLAMAPELKRLGLMVVFDMHTPPGGRLGDPAVLGTAGSLAQLDGSVCMRIFLEDACKDAYVSTWKNIAKKLKDSDIIWGYDLLNEPSTGGQSPKYHYLAVQYAAAKAIREIDPETPIIIEADEWANPTSFAYLQPLPLRNIIYSFHFYMPGEYTHQGTNAATLEKVKNGNMLTYPVMSEGHKVDKSTLRKGMVPVRNFEERYGALIFCGEFSVIRWAPGADQWLNDVTALLEERRWSWTYHAFREWNGWSVEHDENWNNPNPVNVDTRRKSILLNVFKLNRNPYDNPLPNK